MNSIELIIGYKPRPKGKNVNNGIFPHVTRAEKNAHVYTCSLTAEVSRKKITKSKNLKPENSQAQKGLLSKVPHRSYESFHKKGNINVICA